MEGWLVPNNYDGSRLHSFSGRRSTVKDWSQVERQLLHIDRWPKSEDLAWIREQVELDHALSCRVVELEYFFAEIVHEAHPPFTPPDGHRAVFRLLVGKNGARTPGRRNRRFELVRGWAWPRRRLGDRPPSYEKLKDSWRVAGSGFEDPTTNFRRSARRPEA
jgi:hypothetical protein